jgi:benzoyl-CoA 2,3-dioxygenase component B
LSFFLFTYFTDRDGKFQLAALKESAFDPLARTCDFMLKEEAHHMFVGAAGIGRVVQRTAELMVEHDTDDVRQHGAVDLATLQKYINFHYSVSLDLFGSETSTNAANYFTNGLKGRFQEDRRDDDHVLLDDVYPVTGWVDGAIAREERPALLALNESLRDDYTADCAKGLARWNRALAEHGVDVELRLPHSGFHRAVGSFAGRAVTPDGAMLDPDDWETRARDWLPTDEDQEFVRSLMVGVTEPGKMASWVAPPASGIHDRPVEFEYVRS